MDQVVIDENRGSSFQSESSQVSEAINSWENTMPSGDGELERQGLSETVLGWLKEVTRVCVM